MTPEQQQRIAEIEERQQWRSNAQRQTGRTPESNQEFADVDFLLSLVKSQEAEACESCGRSDRHTPECPTAAWCPGCGSRVIGHQWNTCHDAAVLMRSACVEKVKALRDEAESLISRATRHSNTRRRASITFQAYEKAVTALESVSIQEQEAKQS